jgi:hypothetical protein
MKTLDDALSTPGVIEPDTYEVDGDYVFLNTLPPGATIDGTVSAKTLRRIADHLDPQAVAVSECWKPIAAHDKNTYEHFLGRSKLGAYFVFRWDGEKYISIPTGMFVMPDEFLSLKGIGGGRNEPAIRAEARREAFAEAEAQHLANREGYEVFCRAIGMEPDSYEVIAHQVNAKIGRARREALEEAAREAEAAAEKVSDQDESDVLTAYGAATAIRALIEKVPGKGEFPELTLKATEEIRREALEEAARICADLARHDCSALYAGECIRALIEQEPK